MCIVNVCSFFFTTESQFAYIASTLENMQLADSIAVPRGRPLVGQSVPSNGAKALTGRPVGARAVLLKNRSTVHCCTALVELPTELLHLMIVAIVSWVTGTRTGRFTYICKKNEK